MDFGRVSLSESETAVDSARFMPGMDRSQHSGLRFRQAEFSSSRDLKALLKAFELPETQGTSPNRGSYRW